MQRSHAECMISDCVLRFAFNFQMDVELYAGIEFRRLSLGKSHFPRSWGVLHVYDIFDLYSHVLTYMLNFI